MTDIPEVLKNNIIRKNCVLVVGPTFASDAGAYDWSSCVRIIGSEIGCRQQEPAQRVFQYYQNEYGRLALIRRLRDFFSALKPDREVYNYLSQLPFIAVFSFGLDTLLEQALDERDMHYHLIPHEPEMEHWGDNELQVIKMCGTFDIPESLVLTSDDYWLFMRTHRKSIGKLAEYFATRPILILGNDFDYPLLENLFDEIRLVQRQRRINASILAVAVDGLRFHDWERKGIKVINALSTSQYVEYLRSLSVDYQAVQSEQDVAIRRALQHQQNIRDYCDTIWRELSQTKILDTGRPLDLEQVYVSLWVKEEYQIGIATGGQSVGGPTKPTHIDADEALDGYDQMVILGNPGSGKTTLLKHFALRYARDLGAIYLPIFISLADFASCHQSFSDYLQEMLIGRYALSKDFVDYVRWRLERGECLLLLDGMDEVADQEYGPTIHAIKAFGARFSKNKLVVTSRIIGYHNALPYRSFEILELDVDQILRFVWAWFGEDQQRALQLLTFILYNPRIRELAITPFLLTIITMVFERLGELPEARVPLYEQCTDMLLELWDAQKGLERRNRYPKRLKEQLLEKVAFYYQTSGKRALRDRELLRVFEDNLSSDFRSKSNEILKEIEHNSCILTPVSRQEYQFTHLTFQEFFAAEKIASEDNYLQLVVAHDRDPRWFECIRLLSGLLVDSSDLVRLLVERGNPYLAFACVQEARSVNDGLALLVMLLVKYRKDRPEYIRCQAIKPDMAVARLGEEEIVCLLTCIFKHCTDGTVLYGALQVLKAINTSQAQAIIRSFVARGIRTLGIPRLQGMVEIPAGTFIMGGRELGQEGLIGISPEREEYTDTYCIDIHPVTNQEYRRFDPSHAVGERSPSDRMPVVAVTWFDAYMYALWLGKRLPSEGEWEKGARGPKRYRYAYGETYDPSKANTGHQEDSAGAVDVMTYEPNGYGLYEMTGNTWEWTADLFDVNEGEFSPPVIKGGAWYSGEEDCACGTRLRSLPSGIGSDCSFRCAISATEAQATLPEILADQDPIRPEELPLPPPAPGVLERERALLEQDLIGLREELRIVERLLLNQPNNVDLNIRRESLSQRIISYEAHLMDLS